uniref:NADH-ubiquinone oxidoreductase chain 6 n=1 Tax=Sagmariasus verreauxi TaxID=1412110 RepID=U6C3V5_9EUCA|nr:NADH dehydrogenase subunit 6 [Sagmariasus verreauxi]BAO02876.1 NADH dehydrogenase subunit 6 [Sagmariasus verreauxi]
MLMFFLPFIFFLSILFTRLTHPLSVGIILLIQVTLVALASGLSSSSFWFSYILFLIFLGGMLVLFIYVASLASNEIFKVSPLSVIANLTLMFLLSTTMTLIDPLLSPAATPIQHHFLEMKDQMDLSSMSTHALYNFPTMTLTLFVVFYLLLTLIVVVSVTSVSFGPLRTSK